MIQKYLICTLVIINLFGVANAQVDTISKKRINLFVGLNLAKEVSYSAIYSPRNNTLLGFSFGINNFVFKVSANYVNKAVFEKQNYDLGGRVQRSFPISGFELSLIYTKKSYNDKIIHPMFGLEYKKSMVYGGWSNQIFVGSPRISFNRVVNFDDNFYQVCGIIGLSFSSKNKFGFSIYTPIGINTQGSNNSHYLEQIRVGGSSVVYEIKKEGYKNGFIFGINAGIFYNFKL